MENCSKGDFRRESWALGFVLDRIFSFLPFFRTINEDTLGSRQAVDTARAGKSWKVEFAWMKCESPSGAEVLEAILLGFSQPRQKRKSG